MPKPLEVLKYQGAEHVHAGNALLGWAVIENLVCYEADSTAYTVRTLRVNVGRIDDVDDPERWDAVTIECLLALAGQP